MNLATAVAESHRVEPWPSDLPWLFHDWTDDDVSGKAVIARSERYHSKEYPWREVLDMVKEKAVFVGTEDEHKAFVQAFGCGWLPYHHTPNLYQLATAINSCRVFFGNQSTPRAIAEGLKKKVFIEQDPRTPNTFFDRPEAWYSPMCRQHLSRDRRKRDWMRPFARANLAWVATWLEGPA